MCEVGTKIDLESYSSFDAHISQVPRPANLGLISQEVSTSIVRTDDANAIREVLEQDWSMRWLKFAVGSLGQWPAVVTATGSSMKGLRRVGGKDRRRYYLFNITAATSAFVLSSCIKGADGEVTQVKIDGYEDLEHINHA